MMKLPLCTETQVWSLLNDLIPVLLDNMALAPKSGPLNGHRGVFAGGLHEPGTPKCLGSGLLSAIFLGCLKCLGCLHDMS